MTVMNRCGMCIYEPCCHNKLGRCVDFAPLEDSDITLSDLNMCKNEYMFEWSVYTLEDDLGDDIKDIINNLM